MQKLDGRVTLDGTHTYTATQVSQMINATAVQTLTSPPYALSPGGSKGTRARVEHWGPGASYFIQDLSQTVQRVTVTFDAEALVPTGAEVQFRHIPGPTTSMLGAFLQGSSFLKGQAGLVPAGVLAGYSQLGYTVTPGKPYVPINWNRDTCLVWLDLRTPDGSWITFLLGTFLMTLPEASIMAHGRMDTLQLHDFSQLLILQKMQQFTTLDTGASLIGHPGDTTQASVYGLLYQAGFGNTAPQINIPTAEQSGITGMQPTNQGNPIVWPWGTSYLKAINDLLSAAGYYPLWFDATGIPTSRPAQPALIGGAPSKPTAVYTYTSNFAKAAGMQVAGGAIPGLIILPPVTLRLDQTNIANVVQISTQDPASPGGYVARNFTPTNPFSTSRASDTGSIAGSNQGYDIFKLVEDNNLADPVAVYQRAQREVYLASQLYRTVALPIGCNPAHEAHDWVNIYVDDEVKGTGEIMGYQIDLRVGSPNIVGQGNPGTVGSATNQSAGGATGSLRHMVLTVRLAQDLGWASVDYHGLNGFADHLAP